MDVTVTDFIKAIVELGFPVVVAVYLLVQQGKQLERLRVKLIEVRIGLYLILSKMDAEVEYDKAVKEFRKERKADGKDGIDDD